MDMVKGILYTTAAMGMLALYASGGHATPLFVVVHCALFALGVSYILRAARGKD